MRITRVHIERFKNILGTTFELDGLNVLVGANNSGKSSIIQALHFAVGLLQTIEVLGRWPKTRQKVSVGMFPGQPLYTPADNLYSLAAGGRMKQKEEEAIIVTYTLDTGAEVRVSVRKGKNRNVIVAVSGVSDAKILGAMETPFSVFSPGLAGIAKQEVLVSPGVLMRTIARGDSNLVLRNILYRLKEKASWNGFMAHLHSIFPDIELRVAFRETLDEFIHVELSLDGEWIPIELVGTGVLQATQILAYLHLFGPRLIVLDEPDSHLHPNNQRRLCNLLADVSEDGGAQIVLTTHSRHMVDALSGAAQFLWVRNGGCDEVTEEDEIGILLDIGALNVKERLAVPGLRVVVLTEDRGTRLLAAVLEASGFDMGRTTVLPYHGVCNVAAMNPIIRIIKEANPKASVIVHRDRDYWPSDDIGEWAASVRKYRAMPLVSTGVDLEADAMRADHLAALNSELDNAAATELISVARESAREECIEKYVNGRIACERQAGRGSKLNPGELAVQAPVQLSERPERYFHGKRTMAAARRQFREDFGANLKVEEASDHLATRDLQDEARRIFRHEGPE